MGSLFDTLDKRTEGRQVWYANIAVAPTDQNELVEVIIPEFDPHLKWGPCRWQARSDTALPAVGDSCLVIFDNRREGWVVAWWPFD